MPSRAMQPTVPGNRLQAPDADAPVTSRSARARRRVFIHRLELMASVGIFEVEKRYEQRILVSVDLDVRDDYDGISDRLDDVVDYGHVIDDVRRIVAERHFHLIETLAERIAEACLGDRRVTWVRVAVEKPDVVPGCAAVGIAIERTGASD